ncbi:MAG: hypothetical protein LC096_07600, partial [Bacteroidia bacterium]|nr:hypothetical protein [Bacteroidia bacterium]
MGVRLFFCILFYCFFFHAQAQKINNGFVYGGSNDQKVIHSYIDYEGSLYNVISFDSVFQIDSINFINKTFHSSILIVKYDSAGKYLFNIRISPIADFFDFIDIKFTKSNEILICFNAIQEDTIQIIDSRGSSKTIYPIVAINTFDNKSYPLKI